MGHWDLVIIGAGPAGLTAGIYGARSGLRTLILEKGIPGGSVALTPWIENYPGFPMGISGCDLVDKMLQQCKRNGAEIRDLEEVVRLGLEAENKIIETDKSTYSAGAVIITSGCHTRELGVPGEGELRGRGVSYCALCDGALFKGKKVLVMGGGNAAAMSAIYLSNLASKVFLAHRRSQLRAEAAYMNDLQRSGVEILWNTEVKQIKGRSFVESVVLFNSKTNEIRDMSIDGVFVLIGEVPNGKIASEAGIQVDRDGYIVVDSRQRTNIPGVYAAGDITTCPLKQIGTAVGQAILAAADAFGYLKRPYYYEQPIQKD